MAKRAPILPEGYNPVGERLRKLAEPPPLPVALQRETPEIEQHTRVSELVPQNEPDRIAAVSLQERTPIPEVPTARELKETSVRFRCTLAERKKWHQMVSELTGEHSQLSHFARAAFMLLEHSYDHLKKYGPDIQRMKYPAKTDHLGLALYEQRLAEFLYDAIKTSGRPRG
jgi:hypothetical protein